MAFRGTYDHSLDAKNRLTVPAKFRAALSEGAVLAKGIDRCVAVWTPAEYDAFVAATLGRLTPQSEKHRKLSRYLNANSVDAELDSAGRIGLPSWLLEHGRLAKDCVVNGAGDHIEVWDRDAWHSYNASELSEDEGDISALFEQ